MAIPRRKASPRPGGGLAASHGHDREAGGADFHDLLQVCLLLLLRDASASAGDLCEGLRPLGIEQTIGAVEAALDALLTAGLATFVDVSPPDDGYAGGAYAITGDGASWLRDATTELRQTEVVLGRFLARCGERLASRP